MDSLRCAQRYGPTASMAFCILLQNLPSTLQGVDWQISCVLYNLGLAYLVSFSALGDNKALLSAQRMLGFTAVVLAKGRQQRQRQEQKETLTLCLLLESLVLATLATVYRYKNETQNMQDTLQALTRIQEQTIQLEEEDVSVVFGFAHSMSPLLPKQSQHGICSHLQYSVPLLER